MPKRTKRVEAVRAWGHLTSFGTLYPAACIFKESCPKPIRVVILREADYRRLVKAAKGAK